MSTYSPNRDLFALFGELRPKASLNATWHIIQKLPLFSDTVVKNPWHSYDNFKYCSEEPHVSNSIRSRLNKIAPFTDSSICDVNYWTENFALSCFSSAPLFGRSRLLANCCKYIFRSRLLPLGCQCAKLLHRKRFLGNRSPSWSNLQHHRSSDKNTLH